MTLRQYLAVMAAGTIICWGVFLFIIASIDPEFSGASSFLLFYASLFLAIVGTVAVLGFLIRVYVIKQEDVIFRHVRRTFRRGMLFGAILVIALLLQGLELLRWWLTVFLIIGAASLEALFALRGWRPA